MLRRMRARVASVVDRVRSGRAARTGAGGGLRRAAPPGAGRQSGT
jgi:hypothetical protein